MKNIFNWIAHRIASTGENQNFITFMAHSGIACSVILMFQGNLIIAELAVVLVAVKEFWFDLHYEKTPPQTFVDSSLDFVGYLTGIAVALLYIHV